MPSVIAVTGSRGSGKSTLIKALFPELDVDFSEAKLYRMYELPSGLFVAEVCGKPEALGELVIFKPPWRLIAGLVLVDGAQPPRVDGRALALVADAPRRAFVMSKADVAAREWVIEAERLAHRFKFEFFPVSALRGEGVGELKAWLFGAEVSRRPQPTAAPTGAVERVEVLPPFDLVPVPAPSAGVDAGLSEEEKLVLELCDGTRGLREIAETLGIPYGRVRAIVDRLHGRRYIRSFRLKAPV